MLKINQIYVPVNKEFNQEFIAKKLHCTPDDIRSYSIERKSLDARHNEELHYSYSVYAEVKNEDRYVKNRDVRKEDKPVYKLPDHVHCEERPVIVGFGPAGMFASLILAECGARPIIIERGKAVDERQKDVSLFFQKGILNPESNVQYGEGGAGTFSDGKLTSRGKSVYIGKVLQEFVEAGANPEILYDQRPHVGTDVLRTIVKNIRQKIIRLGGDIHFETKMLSLLIQDGKTAGVQTDHGNIYTSWVILATGHSASDTYRQLLDQKVNISQKDFAIGVRVEHPQSLINESTYGKYAKMADLPPASYQLTAKTKTGRGVYSFCMCPGGIVIPASTIPDTLAVNGMSMSTRNGKNANSAILVQIPHSDFDQGHPLDGFQFQKELEKKAWRNGYTAPVENIADYLNHQVSSSLVLDSSYPLDVHPEDMHALFSDTVNAAMEEGMRKFDRKIPGFASKGIMIGMESRSSSPIRINRNQDGQSDNLEGLYPCGEGAGYAGGIVSSGVDGIRQAENILHLMH